MRNRVRHVQTTFDKLSFKMLKDKMSPSTQWPGSRTSRVRLLSYRTFFVISCQKYSNPMQHTGREVPTKCFETKTRSTWRRFINLPQYKYKCSQLALYSLFNHQAYNAREGFTKCFYHCFLVLMKYVQYELKYVVANISSTRPGTRCRTSISRSGF